jgi:hypothetical protein
MRNLSEIMHKIGIHKWADWKYVNPKTCEQERSCEYGDKTQRQIVHLFPGSYANLSINCDGHCSRCHISPNMNETSKEYHCTRCGERLA